MRLIDAEALAYEILSEYGADGGTEDVNTIYGMVINAPTIDAEPVVRCTDCMHWNSETKGCKRNPSVEAWQEDDYCSFGERGRG